MVLVRLIEFNLKEGQLSPKKEKVDILKNCVRCFTKRVLKTIMEPSQFSFRIDIPILNIRKLRLREIAEGYPTISGKATDDLKARGLAQGPSMSIPGHLYEVIFNTIITFAFMYPLRVTLKSFLYSTRRWQYMWKCITQISYLENTYHSAMRTAVNWQLCSLLLLLLLLRYSCFTVLW